jgi:nitroimidazol reductase NimA-like FMN-containing flavoprotein (pyridoxamine 5'-phosphate oxidase superfamily)
VRRREKEVRDLAVALDVLAQGEVMRLAMIAADGAPYVVPLSFAVLPPAADAPLRLLVHAAREGRKIDALRADPRVCFEVTAEATLVPAEKVCAIGVAFRTVIGDGRVRFLEDPAEKARALSAIGSRYARREATVSPDEARNVTVIEIAVESWSCKVSPAPARR